MLSGPEALARLREGNRRFVAGVDDPNAALRQTHRLALTQEPFAIVLGCSDSRVPAELVFGQGFGDLFVIRVAGNIVCRLLLEKKKHSFVVVFARLCNSLCRVSFFITTTVYRH